MFENLMEQLKTDRKLQLALIVAAVLFVIFLLARKGASAPATGSA